MLLLEEMRNLLASLVSSSSEVDDGLSTFKTKSSGGLPRPIKRSRIRSLSSTVLASFQNYPTGLFKKPTIDGISFITYSASKDELSFVVPDLPHICKLSQ